MGNIRTSFVKRLAKELIETHKGVFTTYFDQNKKLVMEYSTAVSYTHLDVYKRQGLYLLLLRNIIWQINNPCLSGWNNCQELQVCFPFSG